MGVKTKTIVITDFYEEHEMNLRQTSRRKSSEGRALKWRSSFLLLSAVLATLLLMIAFFLSIGISIYSIRGLNPLVLDAKIESSLSDNIDNIKKIYALKQKLVLSKLTPYARAWSKHGHGRASPTIVQSWLQTAVPDLLPVERGASIQKIANTDSFEETEPTVEWISNLSCEFLISSLSSKNFPNSKNLSTATDIRARYQLIGQELTDNIIPSILLASSFSILFCFFLLLIGFLVLGQRFHKNMSSIIDGLEAWAQGNTRFRFTEDSHGEPGIICSSFNLMADQAR